MLGENRLFGYCTQFKNLLGTTFTPNWMTATAASCESTRKAKPSMWWTRTYSDAKISAAKNYGSEITMPSLSKTYNAIIVNLWNSESQVGYLCRCLDNKIGICTSPLTRGASLQWNKRNPSWSWVNESKQVPCILNFQSPLLILTHHAHQSTFYCNPASKDVSS
jgi:hypothetical protein